MVGKYLSDSLERCRVLEYGAYRRVKRVVGTGMRSLKFFFCIGFRPFRAEAVIPRFGNLIGHNMRCTLRCKVEWQSSMQNYRCCKEEPHPK
jgi:hypothetical protein